MTMQTELSRLIDRAANLSREDLEQRHVFLNDVAIFFRKYPELNKHEDMFIEFLVDATHGNIDGDALHAFLSSITPPPPANDSINPWRAFIGQRRPVFVTQ